VGELVEHRVEVAEGETVGELVRVCEVEVLGQREGL